MTRIIAGQWKGRTLKVPPSVTRPTSSRVREAIFSSITHQLETFDEIRVLDLYAGSGALGLEAISRGAEFATFVDSDRNACDCVKGNAQQLGARNLSVVQNSVAKFLAPETDANSMRSDLVFIDPPYALSDTEIANIIDLLDKHGWLNDEALVVVERSSKSTVKWPSSFEALQNKTYGDTSIWYGLYSADRVDGVKE